MNVHVCAYLYVFTCLHAMSRCVAATNATQGGMRALMWAAANGHAGCVQMLIDAGADTEAKSKVRVGRLEFCISFGFQR